jgi:hypothetical protein
MRRKRAGCALVYDDLVRRFPSTALLSALNIAYAQYYRGTKLGRSANYLPPTLSELRAQLEVLKRQYGRKECYGTGELPALQVPAKLDFSALSQQARRWLDSAQSVATEAFKRVAAKTLDAGKVCGTAGMAPAHGVCAHACVRALSRPPGTGPPVSH